MKESLVLTLHARGNPNVRATHHKTLEIVAGSELSVTGTCIVATDATFDATALLSLRGRIEVTIAAGDAHDSFTCVVAPTFLPGESLIFRVGDGHRERTFAATASKGAAQLDRALVERLQDPEADVVVTFRQLDAQAAPGVLYLVALPIGNDADLSPRARLVLESVDLTLGEDTRRVRALRREHALEGGGRVRRYDAATEDQMIPQVLDELRAGQRLALISDAGTPLVSDPGRKLVAAAVAEGLAVRPIPGPSAALAALTASGLPTHRVVFAGFLPRRRAERRRRIAELDRTNGTVIVFEAPHRVLETLEDVVETLGDRQVCLARELTKIHEEIVTTGAAAMLARVTETPPRGECTIVIAPASDDDESTDADVEAAASSAADLDAIIRGLLDEQVPVNSIAKAIAAATARSRKDVYNRVLELRTTRR